MGRLVKERRTCQHDRRECQFVWMGEDLLVEKEVMDLGFKYDFELDTGHTSHQCTYMDGDKGIV